MVNPNPTAAVATYVIVANPPPGTLEILTTQASRGRCLLDERGKAVFAGIYARELHRGRSVSGGAVEMLTRPEPRRTRRMATFHGVNSVDSERKQNTTNKPKRGREDLRCVPHQYEVNLAAR